MRGILLVLMFLSIMLSICLPTALAEDTEQRPIRVLAIGNSFTHDTFECPCMTAGTLPA